MTSKANPESRKGEAETSAAVAAAQALDHALARHTALIHEIDHRVKNNLQLISSLLLLQSRRLKAGEAQDALRTMLSRVNAIAAVHRCFFREGESEKFELAEFLRNLAEELHTSAERADIGLDLDLRPMAVGAAHGAPLALIANELVANALGHAYPSPSGGRVEVGLKPGKTGIELSICDSGAGLGLAPAGFGLTITRMLTHQLRGNFSMEDRQPGVRALVIFPVSLELS